MRTTLTLDPDVERLIREAMHRTRATFKEVVNAAVRRGLSPGPGPGRPPPYTVEPHRARLLPGYDLRGFNRLADELEDSAVLGGKDRGAE